MPKKLVDAVEKEAENDNWIPITRTTEIPSEKQEKCVVADIEDFGDFVNYATKYKESEVDE